MKTFIVRFKGHVCAGVMTGLSKHPLLLRKKKDESPFLFQCEHKTGWEEDIANCYETEAETRLRATRAIKFTNQVRRRLSGDHLLRGVPSVERLLRDAKQTRRGKRWKICIHES